MLRFLIIISSLRQMHHFSCLMKRYVIMYGVVLMAASFCSGRWRSPLPKQCLILRCTFDSVLVHLHTLVFVHWWPPLPKQCLTLRCTGATSSRCICGYDLNLVLISQVKIFCGVIKHLDRDYSSLNCFCIATI